ncbi:hypothetical protein [Nocardioides sp. Leaf285]|uniref:hypothetical protein n=1 Tax=Nocardioides sp. Leaf285 TaxID=1736322 RepID=UPI00070267B8|nr:hypothetical protein [Nocardioides sp. Leaf285]KQP66800.1 hypothetical protein ASF47_03485 [Nocardioides sp. Leaf285]
MVASRSARERKASAEGGALALVRIEVGADEAFVYKISCVRCSTTTAKGTRAWWTFRPGEDNGYLAAMDRWTFHLTERHPEVEAPCLAYLEAAQQRLQERRAARGGS